MQENQQGTLGFLQGPTQLSGRLEAVVDVFVQPSRLTTTMSRPPSLVIPWFVLFVLVALSTWISLHVETEYELGHDNRVLTAEEQEFDNKLTSILVVLSRARYLIEPFVVGLIGWTLGLLLRWKTDRSRRPSITSVTSLILHAYLILGLGLLIQSVGMRLSGNALFSLSLSPVAHLAGYAYNSELCFALGQFDIFTIWMIIVVARVFEGSYDCSRPDSYWLSFLTLAPPALGLILLKTS